MKGFSDPSFVNLFSRVIWKTNPALRLNAWEVNGVSWRCERQNHIGPEYMFQHHLHFLTHEGRGRWRLFFVEETWWGPDRMLVMRAANWGKMLEGRKESVFAWLRGLGASLDEK